MLNAHVESQQVNQALTIQLFHPAIRHLVLKNLRTSVLAVVQFM